MSDGAFSLLLLALLLVLLGLSRARWASAVSRSFTDLGRWARGFFAHARRARSLHFWGHDVPHGPVYPSWREAWRETASPNGEEGDPPSC